MLNNLLDIDEARSFIRTTLKKNLYQTCRERLPSLLLKVHPLIYQQLMSELKEDYGKDLDRKVEERLRLAPSITGLAEWSRKVKKVKAAKRKERRKLLERR